MKLVERFDREEALAWFESYKPTLFFGVLSPSLRAIIAVVCSFTFAFGAGSAARHLARARVAGLRTTRVDLPAFARDIDTVADLAALRRRRRPTRGPMKRDPISRGTP